MENWTLSFNSKTWKSEISIADLCSLHAEVMRFAYSMMEGPRSGDQSNILDG